MANTHKDNEKNADFELELRTLRSVKRIQDKLCDVCNDRDLLDILSCVAREHGVSNTTLLYIAGDDSAHPQYLDMVASWNEDENHVINGKSRVATRDFPLSELWISSPKEPLFISDIQSDQRVDTVSQKAISAFGNKAVVIFPLFRLDEWIGLLVFGWKETHELTEFERSAYSALHSIAITATENRRLIVHFGKLVEEKSKAIKKSEQRYRNFVEKHPYGIHEVDVEGKIIFTNPKYDSIFGFKPKEAIGKHVWDTLPAEEQKTELKSYIEYLATGAETPGTYLSPSYTRDGTPLFIRVDWDYIRDDNNKITGFFSVTNDITEQKRAEEEQERLQNQVIESQKWSIQELSTPIIPLFNNIIVMPLIGSIDTARAKNILRSILKGISEHNARIVILDITGVPLVDSSVANHLNKTVQAARLKGAATIVTGISEEVAETIVALGIDWSTIDTLSDLQTGLLAALSKLGIKLQAI